MRRIESSQHCSYDRGMALSERPFGGTELMIDAIDRIGTMNFVTIAQVRGALTHRALQAALRKLQIRHPLLACRIERRERDLPWFVPDASLRIPLRVITHASHTSWLDEAERELDDVEWPQDEAPARLTLLEHGGDKYTLLLAFNHRVSDGSSGVLALRDLLRLVWQPESEERALESKPMEAYLPERFRGVRRLTKCASFWAGKFAEQARSAKPKKLSPATPVPIRERKTHVLPIVLSAAETSALAARARERSTTVQGALTAALLTAIRAELGGDDACTLQCNHPVNVRSLLKELNGPGAHDGDLDERIGYLVSYLETTHAVSRAMDAANLSQIARDASQSLREGRDRCDPIRSLPLVTSITRRVANSGPSPRALRFLDSMLVHNSLCLTNLGRLDIEEGFGAGVIETVHFVAASSFLAPCIPSVTTFRGELRLNFCYQHPSFERTQAERIARTTKDLLLLMAAAASQSATLEK